MIKLIRKVSRNLIAWTSIFNIAIFIRSLLGYFTLEDMILRPILLTVGIISICVWVECPKEKDMKEDN